MPVDPKMFWSSTVKVLVAVILLTAGLFTFGVPLISDESVNAEPTRADGPIVNRSAVSDPTLRFLFDENFETKENILNLTGKGEKDIFYDPNFEWEDPAFEIKYPPGYSKSNTPITIEMDTWPGSSVFGRTSIVCNWENFNSIIYGEEYFKITLRAYNESGEVSSEIWISVRNINDQPVELDHEGDFYSIIIPEDGSFWGLNPEHDPLNVMLGDPNDPFDTLTYTVEKNGTAADHIDVVLESDGSNVTFTPEPDWCSPYVESKNRLNGNRNKTWGQFDFKCTDQDGLFKMKTFWVYIMPVNDTPVFETEPLYTFTEDEMVQIQFSATDADLEYEQRLVYGTNISEIINQRTGIQLEFEEDYDFDADDGTLEFMTDNSMVGEYPVAAWVDDRYAKDVTFRADYPTTDFKVYSNFTLRITNENDPPKAVIDNPIETFIYNTTWPITFDATRSTDPDFLHGQNLTYKWYKNGDLFGEGAKIEYLIEEEGIYNIKVNVSDGEYYSVASRKIEVEKTRILGEIFNGKDMERSYTDNVSDPLVLKESRDGMDITFAGQNSLDIKSITAGRGENQNIYKIRIMFAHELNYIFTQDKEQNPTINIFFLKPDFEEDVVSPTVSGIPSYNFPVPMGSYRYSRMEFDLRQISVIYYPLQDKAPSIRKLDTEDGVEISLTVAEMDQIGVRPDFEIYVTAHVRTQVKHTEGLYTIYTSWDSAGIGSKEPQVGDDVVVDDYGNQQEDGSLVIVIVIVLFILLILVGGGLLLFFLLRKKDDGKKEQIPPEQAALVQPEQSLDQMIFGDQGAPPTAEQIYGAPQQEQLPQGQEEVQQELPPAQQPQDAQVQQQVPQAQAGQVSAETQTQPAPQQIPDNMQAAPAPQQVQNMINQQQ